VAAAVVIALALGLPTSSEAVPPPSGIVVPNAPPGTPLLQLGYQLYAGNCSSCHGTAGKGVKPTRGPAGPGDIRVGGPSLAGVGARAADFYLRTGYMPLGNIDAQPRRGHVLFTPRELDALIAYVAALGSGPPVPRPRPDLGSVGEGLSLFTEHCAGCHQVVARGGYLTGGVAPPLAQATPTQVAEAVRIGPYLMPRFSTRAISNHQLDSIAAYVEYAKHPKDPGGWSIGRLGPIPEGIVAWLVAGTALVACCVAIGRRARA
jgi:ubiquinol-cytochrome c reductase cytochrome c subunit